MERGKEVYLVLFDNQEQADYWMVQMAGKFHSQLLKFNKTASILEFNDSFYYFRSRQRITVGLHEDVVLNPEDIYIILDDPERKRLETFDGGQ